MNRRLAFLLVAVIIVGSVAVIGVTQLQGKPQPEYSADVVAAMSGGDTTGFARAMTVREFSFPRDYAAHPEFQTEWWYYTGNLATAEERRFGFEFTIFRRVIAPTIPARTSDWATNQIYFADLAISDIGANQFYSRERFSRGAAGLAGATADPRVRIWIEDWTMIAQNDSATTMHLKAADGPIAIDLNVKEAKPPVLQGDRGLSAKSPEPGNASYYYSLTRLLTDGTITVNGTSYPVSGTAWKDHEFSTSALSAGAQGWDWFALQLDDQREIMLYQIRLQNGGVESTSHGTLVNADGSAVHLELKDFTIEVLDRWTSPRTGAVYPSRWKVTVQAPAGPITLNVVPLMANQELNTNTAYWEGASWITGMDSGKPVSGYGYVELTGYNRAPDRTQPLTRQGQ
ncbi:MAG: carotenoid 1,2-hydratase [Anaerolineae bacterium]|nr:carotenoid 1,2-hydratase [Anaerolineae bacterium]